MADVFLSYSNKDRPMAEKVQHALEKAGLDVFWDQEVPPGRDWNSWIGEKLGNAKCVIVLWSKTSVASRNVVHEATIALEKGVLIPALIEDLKASDFPMGFYTTQGADLRNLGFTAHEGMDKLTAAVIERVRGSGAGFVRGEATVNVQKKRGGNLVRNIAIGAAAVVALGIGALMFGGGGSTTTVVTEPAVDPNAPAASGISVGAELEVIDSVVGQWDWGGGCGDPSVVTAADGRLTFTTSGSRFVHEIGLVTMQAVETVVLEPQEFSGDVYRLTRAGQQLSVEQVSPKQETNTWTRCGG